MERYDIEKLRSLSCESVAQRLGITVQRHKALCPFHDDHTPSLTFKGSKFKCWSCGESGDSISFVMKVLGKDFLDACRWLADEHNVIVTSFKVQEVSGVQEKPFDASRYERFFERPFLNEEARKFLFEERRLDERVVRWCRLTSWRDRSGTPWLQIPYFNREGKLVGIQNRNLVRGATPRFRFTQGGGSISLYNQPVLNLLRPGEPLFITEGCSDCWAMLSAGHKAIAIPSATLLTQKDVELLETWNLKHETTFHMFPDRDAPGERLFLQLQKVLPSLVHHQLPPDCKDFSEYYLKNPSFGCL
ncbi:MAG: hypothetical protein K6G70_08550 [Bacteroidaceae bacterium]|nr:hypothetical protein [Bacteroidaceae bacterium]